MTRPSLNRPENRTMSYLIPPPTPRPGIRQDEEERMPLLMPSSETLANVRTAGSAADSPFSKLTPCLTISVLDLVGEQTQVYALIHLIRVDVTSHIDTPLTTDQLLAPDSTYTIVRCVLRMEIGTIRGNQSEVSLAQQTFDGEIRIHGESCHQSVECFTCCDYASRPGYQLTRSSD
jgi:hypothetical protein